MKMYSKVFVSMMVLTVTAFLGMSASLADAQYTAQDRLKAKRAAKVDALRNLAEMVYGVRIDSSTTVRDFITQSDTVKARLDSVIQGAREVDYIEHPDGVAEVTVEITLGRVQDIVGRSLDYGDEMFRAAGFGAPSGSPSSYSGGPAPMGDVLRAKGYGVEPADPQMSYAEKSLMAKRAAKIDALRNLLEEVNGVEIRSNTTVRDFVTQSDDMRARVNSFIQGARVVSERQMPDGSYEVEVEIDMNPLRQILQ